MTTQPTTLRTEQRFKKTAAGEIPVDWESVILKDMGQIITGGTPSTGAAQFWDGQFMFVTPTDMSDGRYIFSTQRRVTTEGLEVSGRIPKNAVMVTCIASIGKMAIASEDCCTNQQINSVVCNQRTIPEFLYYALKHRTNILANLAGQTAVPIVNKTTFGEFSLPLPIIAEQRKVAEILSAVDEAIEKTDAAIQKTKKLKKGLMQQLLTKGIGHKKFKKTPIGEIPVTWEAEELGGVCFGRPEYGANVSSLEFNEGLPRYVRITDINDNGTLSVSDKKSIREDDAAPYLLREGDFLFARSGATVGKTYLYQQSDGPCAFAGYTIRFRPDPQRLLPEFLFQLTHSPFYYQWVKGMLRAGAQPNINGTEYNGIFLPIPSLSEQKRITEILSAVDNQISQDEILKHQLEQTKKALMNVLLTGSVRVNLGDCS